MNTNIALYSPIITNIDTVPYPKITAAATITIFMCTFRKMHNHQLQGVAVLCDKGHKFFWQQGSSKHSAALT
jgi:hypothetical protein